jgi:hypothetical protein
MRDMEQIRESFERELQAIDADVVLVVEETHHPPCTCHDSHTETFGVFADPSALESEISGIGPRRRTTMSVRVRKLHE